MHPVVGVDEMMSEVSAPHITFLDSPASPVSDSTATPAVVIDLTTASDRPLLVVVVDDGGATATPTPNYTTTTAPPQADDARAMREAYAGDVAKANRDEEMKSMKVAYTRRWVAETTTPSSAMPSASNWTWSTTSSEVSATSTQHSGVVSTIASRVRGNLAGRTVSRDHVSLHVLQELSDVFRHS